MRRRTLVVALLLSALRCLDGKGPAEEEEKDDDGQPPPPPPPPPHIIFIMADDLGWNDVGFHGSNQIPTPNIDALAYNGLILNNYYVTPVCTPSRSALMTGKHPIHTGMQHRVLYGAEPRGLSLNETLLPQHLKRLGYAAHIVGKWHLGSYKLEYTPTFRGFDTHVGYWTGHQDYFDHTAVEEPYRGLDMRRGTSPAWDLHGEYSTRIFTREAERVIKSHNASRPLFLYLAHAAVHSGNPYDPLRAPDDTVAKFAHIANIRRRKYAAMVSELDESVGRVVAALGARGMLDNAILVFTTDNGGPAEGFNLNAASNWPLRGTKNTLWEGGVRGAALVWSPLIETPRRVSDQMMHISDWLPTLYAAAGGDVAHLGPSLDGVNAWPSLVRDLPSTRKQVLHNIDDIYRISSLRVDEWKIVKGATYNGKWDGWYGPSGREEGEKYDVGQVLGSKASRAVSAVAAAVTPDAVRRLRAAATVSCRRDVSNLVDCHPMSRPCLFNVVDDPCEMENLADRYPSVVAYLENVITAINKTAVPAGNLPWDPRGDPKNWDNTWTNFGDYVLTATVA